VGSVSVIIINLNFKIKNMATKRKPFVKLQCQECKKTNYYSHKSRQLNQKTEKKLELKKYCNTCRKHTAHKETKK